MAILTMKMACKPHGLEAHATSDWDYWTQPEAPATDGAETANAEQPWMNREREKARLAAAWGEPRPSVGLNSYLTAQDR